MGKGWLGTSPQSMADRQFVSDSVQSLPPVRVCTPPARGEGAILRGNYTSSSSEVSLERTPRDYALYGAGRYAAPRPLPHWHSAPAEDPGHLRAAAGEAQHTQGCHSSSASADFQMPQPSPRSSCPSASTAAASCPQCPDSEAKLTAARDAVVDLMQRLTEATEERDEALAAAEREWRLAELLRQELAAIPDHPQAHVASSCGRPSGGLRSSRIPDANSPDRFGADWEAAKRDLAAAGDLHLTPRSSMVSPEQRQRRRHTVGTPAAASEAYYTPAQQLSPAAHGPLPPPQGSAGRQRSPVQRQLVMDGAVAGGSAAAAAWWQSPSGSPPAAPYPSPAFREFPEAVFRVASGELAAAEARAAALERQPSSAGSFIAQLLSPEGGGNAADRVSPQLPQAARAAAESQIAAVAHANSLLQRLQSLASEAADASRLSCGEVPLAHGSSSGAGQTPQPSRCRRSRLSTASREPPTWALGDGSADAASCNLPQALRLIANSGDACLSSLGRRPPRPDSPLAAMQDAVAQMSATARRVRASTALPADGQLSPAGSGCSPTGLDGSAAARVTLKRAKMDMLSAARALAARSSEAQRLLSPVQPPLLSC